jgi:hypothetical protein
MKFPEGGEFSTRGVWWWNRAVRVDNPIPETEGGLEVGKTAAPAAN